MPIQDGKYVAPTWQNGGPPAINADELNAISQSIVNNQNNIEQNTQKFSDYYTKEESISQSTKDFLNLDSSSTPDDAYISIASSEWKLITQIDNTVGMSGTYTVPDFFGDSKAFDIGVYMIGGGGSGAAGVTNYDLYCTGGASGFGKNFIIKNVSPGSQFSWVIGAGGKPGNGSTTSFNGTTVSGGKSGKSGSAYGDLSISNGGQIPDMSQTFSNTYRDGFAPYGSTEPNLRESLQEYQLQYVLSPRITQNSFDTTMVTLGAGGYATVESSSGVFAQQTTEIYGGKAGAGSNSLKGGDATGYGNGGGAAAYKGSGTAVAGYGSDGAIFLYARRSA